MIWRSNLSGSRNGRAGSLGLGTIHPEPVSILMMKWLATTAVIFLLLSFSWAYLSFSGKAGYLVLDRRATVEVNSALVRGEVLEGRGTAIVTRRDVGKEHSYQLLFAGDTDMAGNIGFVVDCHKWVAPRLPFLVETRHYPPCDVLREDGPEPWGWPLINKGDSMQFITKDGSTMRIRR
jgi:hypothetical protein